jgi:GMP/IMP 5'-nucleotidase
MVTPKLALDWDRIDTVLVDMDGTLLDLAFDNFFWLELVPRSYARVAGVDYSSAQREVERRYASVHGTLDWYCVDHWTADLGLDIRTLKREHRHRIRYLPGAREFLGALRSRGKRLILVTNAHRETLAIKIEMTRVDSFVDVVVCSHDYRVPKESAAFWDELKRNHPFAPHKALLLEDSEPVLATAQSFGIGHLVAIRQPDSRHAPRRVVGFESVDGVADLLQRTAEEAWGGALRR